MHWLTFRNVVHRLSLLKRIGDGDWIRFYDALDLQASRMSRILKKQIINGVELRLPNTSKHAVV